MRPRRRSRCLAEGLGELSLETCEVYVSLREGQRPIYDARLWSPMLLFGASGTAWRMVGEAGFRGIPGALPVEDGRRRRPPAGRA
jgi:hypothetical protein